MEPSENINNNNIVTGLGPDTIIFTKKGPKKLCEVQIGDEVVTHDGSFKKVSNILNNKYNGQLFKIKTVQNIGSVLISKNKKIFAINSKNEAGKLKKKLHKCDLEPEYMTFDKLAIKNYVSLPIPEYYVDIINLDIDDCFIYGLMIRYGWISENNYNCSVAFNDSNRYDLLEYFKNYLTRYNIHFSETTKNNLENNNKSINLTWIYKYFKFYRNFIYDVNGNKYINSSILHLPIVKLNYVIKGLIGNNISSDGKIYLETTNYNIVVSLYYMILRIGLGCSISIRDRLDEEGSLLSNGRIIEYKQITYILHIPNTEYIHEIINIPKLKKGNIIGQFYYSWSLYSRIKEIETIDYNGDLFDLEIDSVINTNYLTASGLFASYND